MYRYSTYGWGNDTIVIVLHCRMYHKVRLSDPNTTSEELTFGMRSKCPRFCPIRLTLDIFLLQMIAIDTPLLNANQITPDYVTFDLSYLL